MNQSRGVTISHVAEEAGVSIATVSRVMNGITTVDPALSERVRSVADRMGYRPNAVAQGLARGSTGMVGVMVPDLANPFFHEVLKGIAQAAGADQHRMLVADANEDPEAEKALAVDLIRRVDGLILCSPRMSGNDIRRLAESGLPIVCANRAVELVPAPTLTIDSGRGMLGIVGHLAQLGHRKVAYLSGPEASWSNARRLDALEQAGAFGLETVIVPAGSAMEHGYQAAETALGDGVTAIAAFNDLVALGALARLREMGVDVPGEVSLTGFDDIPFARYTDPPLTTARSPLREMGTGAWDVLRRLLAGERDVRGQRLNAELIVRDTTAPPGS